MTTREEGQAALYGDAEDTSTHHEITLLPSTPSSNSIMDIDGKTATKYSEKLPPTDIWHNCKSTLSDFKKNLINRDYHKYTSMQWGACAFNWKATEIGPNAASTPYRHTCKQAHTCSNATI